MTRTRSIRTRSIRTIPALAAASLSLAAAPVALAHTRTVGDASGTPSTNICVAQIDCTYVNHRHGHPTDVVRHGGWIVDWSLNAASVSGQVQLRILRPLAHGRYKVIASSAIETVSSPGLNTFTTSLKVRRGDVLALSNDTSGLYMSSAPAGTCVRYFDMPLADGQKGRTDRVAPRLHLELTAHVSS